MTNFFDQFDNPGHQTAAQQPTAGGRNFFDEFDEDLPPEDRAAAHALNHGGNALDAEIAKSEAKLGFWDKAKNLVTGNDRLTPDIKGRPEIGSAPELNEFSGRAFKTSLGLMTESTPESVMNVLREQFGDQVSFRQDEKGNHIAILPSGEYPLNKPGLSPQDVIRGIFDAAAFLPSTRGAGIIATGLKGAATQGTIEGAGVAVGGDMEPGNVLMAGGVNAAGKAAEGLVGAGYRLAKGSVANDVVKAGDALGIPVHTSDVVQPQTFAGKITQQTAEKIPFFGTGAMRESQQKARVAAVGEFIGRHSDFSYTAIVDSLKRNGNRIKQAAGNVLESTGNQLDDIAAGQGMPTDKTMAAIQAVQKELAKPGVIQSSAALNDLDTLLSALTENPQTFTTLRENRTAFRELINGIDKAERSQLPTRAKALLYRVAHAMKDDMDVFAKQHLDDAAYQKWGRANSVYAREAEKLKSVKLKSVLDTGDATPENVRSLLFSAKPSEVKTLYDGLTPAGKANARAAIVSRVADDLSKRAGGVTPNAFISEMRKHGLQTSVFFKGEDLKSLAGLMKVLDATRRAQDAAVTTPTGQQLLGALGVTGIAVDPVRTIGAAGAVGYSARVYESAAVRNILLRIRSIPPGSTQFEQALRELDSAVLAGAQALRDSYETPDGRYQSEEPEL